MKCENKSCIYESKGECILDKVDIDSIGMCTECMYAEIDEKTLTQIKQKLLNSYEKDDK